jgi:hypothetical protein
LNLRGWGLNWPTDGQYLPRNRREFMALFMADMPKITPHSRLLRRGCIDGRSREGRFLAAARAELAAHVGGDPSRAEAVLIDRVAWLRLHIALIDERAAGGNPMSAHDQRAYLAFSNAVVRAMQKLGLRGAPERGPSLAEHLARRAAERERQAAPA